MNVSRSIRGFLVFFLLILLTGTVVAQGPQQVTGWISVLYGDSPTASQQIITLTTEDGARYRVNIGESALRRAGGLISLAGKKATVEIINNAYSQANGATLTITNILRTEPTRRSNNVRATNYNWVNLMCQYNGDTSEDVDTTYIASHYGSNYRNLNHYFPEISRNEISVSGDVFDWRTLPNDRQYYLDNDTLVDLWVDCIGLFNDDIDFSSGVDGIAIILNDQIDGFAWGGGVTGTLDGVNQNWPSIWMPPWAYTSMNVWTHEMGHAYGLPHSNNSDGDSDPYDNPWDMMSGAWSSTQVHPTFGTIPMYTISYHLDRLGWMPASKKFNYAAVTTELKLDSWYYADSTKYHMAVIPGAGGTFYTVEARKHINGDFTAYEDGLAGGNGVVIHHVDEGRGEPAWLINNGTDLTPWRTDDTWTAPDGTKVKVLKATNKGFKVRIGIFPDSPTNLVAVPVGREQIDLSWNDTADDFGYVLEWSPDGTNDWQELAHVGQNVTAYSDDSLTCETTRYYRVYAKDNGGGLSDPSNIADATTTTCPTELVTNGGFEDGAWYWIPPGAVPNNIVCGGGIAFEGDCAYKFSTDKGEHVKVKQMVDLGLAEFVIDGGDTLVINGAFNAIGDISRGEFVVKVQYVDDLLEDDKIVFPIHATVGWEEIAETEFVIQGLVDKIVVEVSYKGKNGTVYVDAVSVGVLDGASPLVMPVTAADVQLIPLPEAPDGFRR